MLYTTSELLKLIKADMGLRDLPKVISDEDMLERLYQSSLKEFSIRCPNLVEAYIGDNERISTIVNKKSTYRIPKTFYDGSNILYVTRVDPLGMSGFSDFYAPFGLFPSADAALITLSDYKLAATIQQTMNPTLTFNYRKPDILEIYNGWSSGSYMVELALVHDISLATIPDTAMSSFKKLALLDMKEYFYNTLKRMDNINTGAGEIQLKIDEWSNAGDQKNDLLKEWDEDASLDVDTIKFF